MQSSRRDFLGFLGLVALAPVARVEARNKHQRFILHECFIAGFRFHEGPDIMPYLQPGESLTLTAEPDNPHDPWAVRVEHNKSHIGYLPRTQNEFVARLLQQDAPVSCVINAVDEQAVPWQAVRIQVSVVICQGPQTARSQAFSTGENRMPKSVLTP